MNIKFHVNRQHIARTDRAYVVAGSRNFLGCEFTFTPEWAGIVKTAIFQNGDTAYHVVLENDAIAAAAMPYYPRDAGISPFLAGISSQRTARRLLLPGQDMPKGQLRQAPSATVYETLSGMISQAIAKTDALEEKIEGGTSVAIADGTLYIN